MADNVKITILVDNHAGGGLVAEHGLSFWIEAGGKKILFDTGQGHALAANAHALRIPLHEADMVVLSHGHYDHTGGLADVLHVAGKAVVYCHAGVVQPRYSIRNGAPKPIHMPRESMVALDRLPLRRLRWVRQPLRLAPGVGITGPIPRETHYEDTGGPFYLDPEGKRKDPIVDDLALWVEATEGVVICVGCSHAGLINTLNHVRRLSRGMRIQAVLGGFHLLGASEHRLEQTAEVLCSLAPGKVVPCHCTGEHATAALRVVLGSRVSIGKAGVPFSF